MDEILKYHRLQGKFRELLKTDSITTSAIENNSIIIGTEQGYLHILSFIGQTIKSFKPHDRAVTCVSSDCGGTTIASCSSNGTVVVYSLGDEDKESTIHLNQPLRVVSVENESGIKRERSLLIGSENGQLIHHKTVWFSQKNLILFSGAGSPVTTISWRGEFVAWSDFTAVRVMNLQTQTAICYLNSPLGVSFSNPFPCCLFWESPQDLFIGWADNFRHLEFISTQQHSNYLMMERGDPHHQQQSNKKKNPSQSQQSRLEIDASEMGVRILSEWQTDCLICGISSFDVDHLVILGYVPPEEQEVEEFNRLQLQKEKENEPENQPSSQLLSQKKNEKAREKDALLTFPLTNRPELQILKKSTGELISSDVLPLVGKENLRGPQAFSLLSSYFSPVRGWDARRWSLSTISPTPLPSSSNNNNSNSGKSNSSSNESTTTSPSSSLSTPRGGNRGYSPSLFVISPQDLVGIRVRDVNDRIASALQAADLTQAANLAFLYKSSLRNYHYHDIISLYLEDLLDRGLADFAGKECAKYLGLDVSQWEKWISAFAKRKSLESICFSIPTENPRLSSTMYEVVLEVLLQQNSKLFSEIFFSWMKIEPPLFSHRSLLTRLEGIRKKDVYFLQVQAQLYIRCHQFEDALNCYLEISYPDGIEGGGGGGGFNGFDPITSVGSLENTGSIDDLGKGEGKTVGGAANKSDPYQQVFDLIEKEKLFNLIRDKIKNLLRLSRELTATLLIRNVDQLPILYIARQLRSDHRLLHWYLHTMFCFVESYNLDPDYSELHALQVSLYAEFAFSFQLQTHLQIPTTSTPAISSQSSLILSPSSIPPSKSSSSSPSIDTDFLYFLRNSKFYSLDFALRECERTRPPLYREMVFLLDVKGMVVEALTMLLREIPNPMSSALSFIASHERAAQPSLWKILIDHTLKHSEGGVALGQLLDYLAEGEGEMGSGSGGGGVGWEVIARIPPHSLIPKLRERLMNIVHRGGFQVFVNSKCNRLLEADALDNLRRLNQNQRRAQKVDPNIRCYICARPLILPAGSPLVFNKENEKSSSTTTSDLRIWGGGVVNGKSGDAINNLRSTGVVVYTNKQCFHRICFDRFQNNSL